MIETDKQQVCDDITVKKLDHNEDQPFHQINQPSGALPTLSDEQRLKINQLRERCEKWISELGEDEKKFMRGEFGDYGNDENLYFRYLEGYGWNKLDEAEQGLKETCAWRANMKPHQLKFEDIKKEVREQEFILQRGNDKEGHPVLYVHMGKDKLPSDSEERKYHKYLYFVYWTEQTILSMKNQNYQITWVIDVQDTNLSVSLAKSMKNTFLDLGIYYCDRLSYAVIVNCSFSISLIWKFVRPFLTNRALQRYYVFSNSKDGRSNSEKKLNEIIGTDHLFKNFSLDLTTQPEHV